jgi:ATP-dependent Clp protease ATP-binding subunit ClpA
MDTHEEVKAFLDEQGFPYTGKLTEGAIEAVRFAAEEARVLRHTYIGTEHMLLGLLREEQGRAARALEELDVTVERIRAQVVRVVGTGDDDRRSSSLSLTPRAKQVLELSQAETLAQGEDKDIDTEHMLLAIVCNEGVAARILLDFDATPEKVRAEVMHQLASHRFSMPSENTAQDEAAILRPGEQAVIVLEEGLSATMKVQALDGGGIKLTISAFTDLEH